MASDYGDLIGGGLRFCATGEDELVVLRHDEDPEGQEGTIATKMVSNCAPCLASRLSEGATPQLTGRSPDSGDASVGIQGRQGGGFSTHTHHGKPGYRSLYAHSFLPAQHFRYAVPVQSHSPIRNSKLILSRLRLPTPALEVLLPVHQPQLRRIYILLQCDHRPLLPSG